MFDNDTIIAKRVDFLKHEFQKVYNDFQQNLKPKLLLFEHEPFSKQMLVEIQNEIDHFLHRNNLKISVYATSYKRSILILGETMIDNLVWESFQKQH